MSKRELFDVELRPAAGSRFQPTGFPDIGAATFSRPVTRDGVDTWEECLLVESAQSMANHLEATVWDRKSQAPISALEGLPYVRVVDTAGNYLSSSRTEAHRLAGAFVKDARLQGISMKEVIRDRLQLKDETPLAPSRIASAIFGLDPLCLVHGVFFAEKANVWPGQPKIPRALTAFVEAVDVREATSGGVKRDDVRHNLTEGGGGAAEGYGFVPFHRTEWVARRIIASFSIDHEQIIAYGLPDPASDLLVTIARLEVRRLLDGGFRPRTACDLVPIDDSSATDMLPSATELESYARKLVADCRDLIPASPVLDVIWAGDGKKKAAT